MAAYNFAEPFSSNYTFIDGETKLVAEMFDNLKAELKDIQKNLWQAVYPVGSIYISTSNANPATLFGGIWEAYGRGRTLVSADSEGAKSVAGHTFGSAYLQAHTHEIAAHTHTATTSDEGAHSHKNVFHYEQITVAKGTGTTIRNGSVSGDKTASDSIVTESSVSSHTHNVTIGSTALVTNNAGEGRQGNYQPSIIVYMFRRTA